VATGSRPLNGEDTAARSSPEIPTSLGGAGRQLGGALLEEDALVGQPVQLHADEERAALSLPWVQSVQAVRAPRCR
jgi:hypothetical protein